MANTNIGFPPPPELTELPRGTEVASEQPAKEKRPMPKRDAHGHFLKKDGSPAKKTSPKKQAAKPKKEEPEMPQMPRLVAGISADGVAQVVCEALDSIGDSLSMLVDDVSTIAHRRGFVSGFAWGAIVTAVVGVATFFIAH